MRVYLGGGMGGRSTAEVRKEREYAKHILTEVNIAYYDPMEDEIVNQPIVPSNYPLSTMTAFRDKDYSNLRECTHFINLDGDYPSVGTVWEMAFFRLVLCRPVIVVSESMYNKRLCNFTTVEADKIVERVESAILYLQSLRDTATAEGA